MLKAFGIVLGRLIGIEGSRKRLGSNTADGWLDSYSFKGSWQCGKVCWAQMLFWVRYRGQMVAFLCSILWSSFLLVLPLLFRPFLGTITVGPVWYCWGEFWLIPIIVARWRKEIIEIVIVRLSWSRLLWNATLKMLHLSSSSTIIRITSYTYVNKFCIWHLKICWKCGCTKKTKKFDSPQLLKEKLT